MCNVTAYEKSRSSENRNDWLAYKSYRPALGKGSLDFFKLGFGVGTDCCDSSDTHDNNQGHHDGVFNSRRTIF